MPRPNFVACDRTAHNGLKDCGGYGTHNPSNRFPRTTASARQVPALRRSADEGNICPIGSGTHRGHRGLGDNPRMDRMLIEEVSGGTYSIDPQAVAAAIMARERARMATRGLDALITPQVRDGNGDQPPALEGTA